MISFTIEQKRIDVFPGARPNTPAIYLNTYGQEGKQVFQYMRETGCPDFSLVAVSNLEWEHDMAPWDIPPIWGQRCALYRRSRWLPETSSKSNSAEGGKSIAGYPFLAGESPDTPWPDCLQCIRFIKRMSFHVLPVYPVPCGFLESKSTSFPICLRKSLPVCTFRWATGNVIPETNF